MMQHKRNIILVCLIIYRLRNSSICVIVNRAAWLDLRDSGCVRVGIVL